MEKNKKKENKKNSTFPLRCLVLEIVLFAVFVLEKT